MIRMILLATGFVAITVALLFFQSGLGRQAGNDAAQIDPVTRAEPGLAPIAPPVTRAPAPVTPAPVAALASPRVDLVPDGTAPTNMDDESLRHMTWQTLSGLNQAIGRESAPGQPGSLLHTIVRRSLSDGPSDGTVRVPAPQGTAVAAVGGRYVVQQGDSLVSIAQKIYGDVNMTGPLFAANRSTLSRPDNLRPGQILLLPEQP